jgi:hypothetical protein
MYLRSSCYLSCSWHGIIVLTETSADEKDEIKVYTSFDEMNLKDDLLRGIYAYGFEKPSAIQQRGILPIVSGRDTVAQAQSGTGKTGAFAISILQRIDIANKECQGILTIPFMSHTFTSTMSTNGSTGSNDMYIMKYHEANQSIIIGWG